LLPWLLFSAVWAMPAHAKGPPGQSLELTEPRDFGAVRLARGSAAIYFSGGPAYGTLDRPLAVGGDLVLPAGALTLFSMVEPGSPSYPVGAYVRVPFGACGYRFGSLRNAEKWPRSPWFFEIPKNTTFVRVVFPAPGSGGPPSIEGQLFDPVEYRGLSLPAGSLLRVSCGSTGASPAEWRGQLERDVELGGVVLRARAPMHLQFSPSGAVPLGGTLAAELVLAGRVLDVGTRFDELAHGIVLVTCADGTGAALTFGSWSSAPACSRELLGLSAQTLSPRAPSRASWALCSLGVSVALLGWAAWQARASRRARRAC
jgi:hypothetical protein